MEEKKRGGARPGAGRPAPPGGRRSIRTFTANDEEWKGIQKRAKEAGKTISEYIRKKTLGD